MVITWHMMVLCAPLCLGLGDSRLSRSLAGLITAPQFAVVLALCLKLHELCAIAEPMDALASLITVRRGALHAALMIMQPLAPLPANGAHESRDQREYETCFIPV